MSHPTRAAMVAARVTKVLSNMTATAHGGLRVTLLGLWHQRAGALGSTWASTSAFAKPDIGMAAVFVTRPLSTRADPVTH